MKPVLYMTVGIPASGKSYWAAGKTKDGVHHHSSDDIRKELGLDQGEMGGGKVFELLAGRVRDDLRQGFSVIYDATCMTRKRRMAFLESLKNIDCEKRAVLFLCPLAICRKRNSLRDEFGKVPAHTFPGMLRSFEIPDAYEGFDAVDIIRYTGEYTPEYKKIRIPEKLENGCIIFKEYMLNSLEAGELACIPQDNVHHEHSLGEHIKMVGDMMKQKLDEGCLKGDDQDFRKKCLLDAAYHHDIGKVFTKAFKNYKGEDTETAHFYGHENFGAYIYLTEKLCLPEGQAPALSEDEIIYTAQLINWHMRPQNTWDKSAKKREHEKEMLERRYPYLYDDICLLHECDTIAH